MKFLKKMEIIHKILIINRYFNKKEEATFVTSPKLYLISFLIIQLLLLMPCTILHRH